MSATAITGITQIAINAHDLPRATAFYRDRLGLKHLFDAPPAMSFFDCGGIRLMLSQPSAPEFDHASSILYFTVADIQGAHREFSARGVPFIDEPHLLVRMAGREIWLCAFKDSEGNTLELMSEVAK